MKWPRLDCIVGFNGAGLTLCAILASCLPGWARLWAIPLWGLALWLLWVSRTHDCGATGRAWAQDVIDRMERDPNSVLYRDPDNQRDNWRYKR
jgi:hypothetical protein